MNMRTCIALVLGMTLGVACLTGCTQTDAPAAPPSQEGYGIVLLTQYNGAQIDPLSEKLSGYLALTEESAQVRYLFENTPAPGAYALNYDFRWEPTQSLNYQVHFSENADFSHEYVLTVPGEACISDMGALAPLPVGKLCYWKVTDELGNSSITDSFVVRDYGVRIIQVAGADNIRDLGGWKTVDGKTVAYGKIYRGGRLNSITPRGMRTMNEVLGIRSELDLRGEHDNGGQTGCAFDPDKTYVRYSISQYGDVLPGFRYNNHVYLPDTAPAVQEIFAFLADEENYPIYMHCNAGADRTGTLSYLINGLLGVPLEDLTRDFELTSFSSHGIRWRGSIENGVLTGSVMQDDALNYVGFYQMHEYILETWGEGGTLPLHQAIENYLIQGLGIPQEHVDSLKNIMLE